MYTKMKYGKKYIFMSLGVILLLSVAFLSAGCGKKYVDIKVFQYETGDDGSITITGLTDKGESDSLLNVPASIDGAKVVSIGAGAFRDNDCVNKVVIEEGVERISENVFLNCTMLKDITIPASVSTIGTNAFGGTEWEKAKLDGANEVVVNNILVKVKAGMKEYTMPSEVKKLAPGLFYSNTEITKVIVNSGLEYIGDYCFADCPALTQVQLPAGIKEIGYCAFNNCTALEINVPAGVASIGQDAFTNVLKVEYAE